MASKKILAINIGSTSTKLAYFEDQNCIIKDSVTYNSDQLSGFATFWDQENLRAEGVETFIQENNIDLDELDAIAAWGGHTEPVEDGVYRINEDLLRQSRSEKYGNHPGDLAPRLAYRLANKSEKAVALSIDPPTIDEFSPLARYTGLPEITRKSRMQSLNQKATARQYARDINKAYEDLNIIVINMGGGTSIVSHKHGKMVDANNGLDGDGPFATNRAGTLPAGDLIDLCFNGGYTRQEMRNKITGQGGLIAWTGSNDIRTIVEQIEQGNRKSEEVLDAMIYQICKEAGSQATVLDGKVDAILLTGGVAYSEYISSRLKNKLEWIAPVHVYAGELEMTSLGLMSYEALSGKREIKEFIPHDL